MSTSPRDDAAEWFRSRLRQALAAALKSRDTHAIGALRTVIAAIDNAEAPAPPPTTRQEQGEHIAGAGLGVGSTEARRRRLSRAVVRQLMEEQITERIQAADHYGRAGRTADSERLRREAAVLSEHLALLA